MAEIEMKRFDGAMVTPKDDAIIFEKAVQKNGIMYGCDLTYLGASQVHIAAGKGIYKGRDFDIAEQTLNVMLSDSGTKSGRMYVRIDLSNAETPIDIISIAADILPAMQEDEDFNRVLGVGEMELAIYTAGEVAITDLTETFEYVGNPYKELEEKVDKLNSDLSFPDGVGFFPDIQDGVRGYNTDAARGADTFVPFKSGEQLKLLAIYYTGSTGTLSARPVLDTDYLKALSYNKYEVLKPFDTTIVIGGGIINEYGFYINGVPTITNFPNFFGTVTKKYSFKTGDVIQFVYNSGHNYCGATFKL